MTEAVTEDKKKKKGSDEVVFIESIKRAKTDDAAQTTINSHKEKEMPASELQVPSVAIVVIDDEPVKTQVPEFPVDSSRQSERMKVDKNTNIIKTQAIEEEEKKNGDVH